MALDVIIAPRAERDIEDIHAYVSADNPVAADGVIGRFRKTIGLLALRPNMGPRVLRPGRRGLRKMSVPPFIIFYRVGDDLVEIVRVLHSSRDVDNTTP
ncbi:type II toxin-antitoxin system RelE/ParE family toxin [Chelativorans sp. ZYF759]|uniref:type II toxin-antitoxin system RelE/ParE family toxin n=1 Tax=Chelativorans sp. ZYF759 TaxID=2692213 RepID=UPI00145C9B24|nr:type II toxin-antitoxin system RelE/ParE family toxin [Chelativorans sp. ZYF759]NMG41053.1 type II toxin-antitoxin system RelE/ParE family toxin [Chelativorans sp. ZYF759]